MALALSFIVPSYTAFLPHLTIILFVNEALLFFEIGSIAMLATKDRGALIS